MRRILIAIVVLAAAGLGFASLYPPTRPAVLAALARIGVGNREGGTPQPAPGVEAPRPPAIVVVEAATREFQDRLFVSGSLVAREEALVGPQIDGLRITELLADDGDRVEKGQVLARLDRTQLDALAAESDAALLRADAAIAQARSQITQYEALKAQAEADFARGTRLPSGIMTQASLDQRSSTARSAQAQVAAANSALAISEADRMSQQAQRRELEVRRARTEVRAPVAGLVSRRSARLGALVMSSGDPLFRIIADGAIDLDAEAPDNMLARVKLGLPASVTLQGNEVPLAGTVRLIASEVDKTTRLGRIRIALPADARARIGSFATATVEIARREGVSLPVSALSGGEGGWSVQVLVGGHVEVRPVRLGLSAPGVIEVTQGLRAGETVVARAAAFLRGGDAIRPMAMAEDAPR